MNTLASLEKISIDLSKVLQEQVENYEQTFRKFLLRLARHQGLELGLSMKVISELSGSTLKDAIVKALGLEWGNTLSVDVNVLGKDGTLLTERNISVYGEKENAIQGSIIKARIKTAYCALKELSS